MTQCPTRQQLEQYLDEQIGESDRATMESHVSGCQNCQQILETAAMFDESRSLHALHSSHSSAGLQPSGEFLHRVEQAVVPVSEARSAEDVVIQITSDYVSPAYQPGIPGVSSVSGLPTRQASVVINQSDIVQQALAPGTVLGQYRIIDQLGAGGMGHVYKAVHIAMDRVVALKVIAPHLVRDAQARARFQQEVRTAAKLHHPNIVLAHDAAEASGFSFLVMEHVEGTTLSTLMSEHGLPPVPLACEVIRQTALGLQHAKDQGMVHRDIKPGNLMVAAQQTAGGGFIVPPSKGGPALPGWPTAPLVKILDFGVARLRSLSADGEPMKMQTLTQEGCVVGTPEFMSPEQACDSRNVDIRSDIYSLGCTLFYLLTGRPPFSGATALETMVQHLKQPLPAVEQLRPGLPPALVGVLTKMLEKAPSERLQTPVEVAEALRPWTGDFASSVAPDNLIVERGLAPTAAMAAEATSSAIKTPPPTRNSNPVVVPVPLAPPPNPPWSNTATFLSLLALFLVSGLAYLVVSMFMGDHPTTSGPKNRTQSPEERLGIRLVKVPRGQFHRWFSPKGQITRFDYDLEVLTTEVTRAQFAEFVKQTNYETRAEQRLAQQMGTFNPTTGKWDSAVNWKHCGTEDKDVPVTCISWEDAVNFCNWLSQQTGKEACYTQAGTWRCRFDLGGYRLPTEAEWEYIARGSASEELLPAAPAAMHDQGWLAPNANGAPHPVGQRTVNGLQDMWGNVWEWCWDWYTDQPREPNGPLSGKDHSMWGGGWHDTPEQLAKEPRRGKPPTYRATDVGFRIVRTVTER